MAYGVREDILAKYKGMRPRAETDTEEEDGSPKADIVIDGTIVDDEWKQNASGDAFLVSPNDVKEQIEKLPEGAEEIRVLINSPGGSVFAAKNMIDMINDLKAVITVRVRGIAASAGALIAIKIHDELEMSSGAFLMVHQAMINGMNRQALAKFDSLLEKIDNDQVNSIYAASALTREEAKAALDGGDLVHGCGGFRCRLHHEATGGSGTEQWQEAQTKGCAGCCRCNAPRPDWPEPGLVGCWAQGSSSSETAFFHHPVRCNHEVR